MKKVFLSPLLLLLIFLCASCAENLTEADAPYTCTVSIRCDTVLDNINMLNQEKLSLIPKDGVILSGYEVSFSDGDNVFNAILTATRENKIHFEFSQTPMYKSAYIEGIANLYEFDCDELSGWLYKVNGVSPSYGCSLYELEDGDIIELIYTCDMGRDVAGVAQSFQEETS